MSKIQNMSAVSSFNIQNAVVASNPEFYPEETENGKKCFINFRVYANGWKKNIEVGIENPVFLVSARGDIAKMLARNVFKGKIFSMMELKLQIKKIPKTYKTGEMIYEKNGEMVMENAHYYDIKSFTLADTGEKTIKDHIAKKILSPYWRNSVPREKLLEAAAEGKTINQVITELDAGYSQHQVMLEQRRKEEFKEGNKYFGNALVIYKNPEMNIVDNRNPIFPGTYENVQPETIKTTGTANIEKQPVEETLTAESVERLLDKKLTEALDRLLGSKKTPQKQTNEQPPPFEVSGII